ncbi:hypothetical protein L1049_024789 [Liquidambar formosana]|uniref:Helicase/UvrB N-terminal domain-containing protein n=1 Tax=Liquidambar formosana TaxID=63359 RepID=A0AAP0WYR6_LIQFO
MGSFDISDLILALFVEGFASLLFFGFVHGVIQLSYQLDALKKAINQNTIVFLETGSGKTLIAIMLLRSYAYLL